MRIFEMVDDNGGYDPQHDKMPPVPEKQGFWTKPYTPRERKILIGCSIGLVVTVVLYVAAVYPNF